MRHGSTSHGVRPWTLAIVCFPAPLLMLLFWNSGLDDPFIAYRYAANMVSGHGPVWNPGEDPVEGYTSFTWVMLNALPIRLGLHPLTFSKAVGAASAFLIVLLPLSSLNTLLRGAWAKGVVALCLSACPLLAFYGASGMEHALFTLLAFLATLTYLRWLQTTSRPSDPILCGALLGASALTRPEGLGLFGILILFEAYRQWRHGGSERSLRPLWHLSAPFLLLWLPYNVWRLSYYGYAFPNTFYAKHTGGGLEQVALGILYLGEGFEHYLAVPMAFALPLMIGLLGGHPEDAAGAEHRAPPNSPAAFIVFFLACFGLYIVLVGGDDTAAFPSTRLVLPALPLAFLLAGIGLESAFRDRRARVLSAAVLIGLSGIAALGDLRVLVKASLPSAQGLSGVSLGRLAGAALSPRAEIYEEPELSRWIRDHTSPSGTVAMPWVGRVAYYCQRNVLDMLGLNDEYLSHLPKRQRGIDVKMDANYVLSREPELILINVNRSVIAGKASFEEGGGWKIGDRELLQLLSTSPDYSLVVDAPTEITAFQRTKRSVHP